MRIGAFQIVRPRHEIEQEKILHWLASARLAVGGPDLRAQLLRLGSGKDKVQSRGSQLRDPLHEVWDEMDVYRLADQPEGLGMGHRSGVYDREMTQIVEKMYEGVDLAPDQVIHVSCTGYVSPSPVQRLISRKGWGMRSVVTHAYHMGCYASIPALRIAQGFASVAPEQRIDVIHTEFCSLHMNPMLNEVDQLVVQTLFADGFIRYQIGSSGFEVLKLHEEILPSTTEEMSWQCLDWGMKMWISKHVPELIGDIVGGFVERMGFHGGEAIYAIHPGGPRIIDRVAAALKAEPDQIRHSREVLRKYGNMSSATLPHIWEAVLRDETVAEGTFVVSLAFGPGLTCSGAIFQKRC